MDSIIDEIVGSLINVGHGLVRSTDLVMPPISAKPAYDQNNAKQIKQLLTSIANEIIDQHNATCANNASNHRHTYETIKADLTFPIPPVYSSQFVNVYVNQCKKCGNRNEALVTGLNCSQLITTNDKSNHDLYFPFLDKYNIKGVGIHNFSNYHDNVKCKVDDIDFKMSELDHTQLILYIQCRVFCNTCKRTISYHDMQICINYPNGTKQIDIERQISIIRPRLNQLMKQIELTNLTTELKATDKPALKQHFTQEIRTPSELSYSQYFQRVITYLLLKDKVIRNACKLSVTQDWNDESTSVFNVKSFKNITSNDDDN